MPPNILVLGLPRTGTQSLCDAIETLTHEPLYHMREVAKNSHQKAWIALLDGKFARQEAPEAQIPELKNLLEPYYGLADFPASIFAPELLLAYPEAKVIVTQRDETAWADSMLRTLISHHLSATPGQGRPDMRELREKYHGYCWRNDFAANGLTYYREYHREVRGLVEGRQVLGWDISQPEQVSWARLGEFLGMDVPKGEFPRSDEQKAPHSTTAI